MPFLTQGDFPDPEIVPVAPESPELKGRVFTTISLYPTNKNGDVDRICRRPPQGPVWFQLPPELVRRAKYGLGSVTEAISESSQGMLQRNIFEY